MNKVALKRTVGHGYRLRPMAKRFKGGPGGLPLPPVDDIWKFTRFDKDGIWLENTATHRTAHLGWDHIYDYLSDSPSGQGSGFLNLKVQVNIGGDRLWMEPTFRPGQALPDQFTGVHAWKRENDPAYLQSTLPATPSQVAPPSANIGLGLVLALCVGFSVGVMVANA